MRSVRHTPFYEEKILHYFESTRAADECVTNAATWKLARAKFADGQMFPVVGHLRDGRPVRVMQTTHSYFGPPMLIIFTVDPTDAEVTMHDIFPVSTFVPRSA